VLIGVYVHEPSGLTEAEPAWLGRQRQLLSELGGHYVELAGIDVATTLLDFARTEDARQLVLGATRRSRLQELLHGSVINKAIRTAGSIEISVIPPRRRALHVSAPKVAGPPPTRRVAFPGPRRAAAWALAVVAPLVVTIGLVPLRASLGLAGELLCALLSVVGVALLGGIRPALLATGVSFLASDYLYTAPLYSFQIARVVDLVAMITFAAVAVIVGGLVDLLTRQGVRVARADAEAANLVGWPLSWSLPHRGWQTPSVFCAAPSTSTPSRSCGAPGTGGRSRPPPDRPPWTTPSAPPTASNSTATASWHWTGHD
jgi:two-component system sensor histidine kinase KdpD